MPTSRVRCAGAFLLAGAWFLAALLAVSSAAWSAPASTPHGVPLPDVVPPTADGQLPVLLTTRAGAAVADRVRELGGRVGHVFANDGLVSATVPAEAIALLRADGRVEEVARQHYVYRAVVEPRLPGLDERYPRQPVRPRLGDAFARTRIAPVTQPAGGELRSFQGYEAITHAAEVGEDAAWGEDVIVAIVDTGVFDHPLYDSNVVGGENLVPEEEEMAIDLDHDGTGDGRHFDWNALENNGHGTFVAGIIAGHALVEFDEADPVLQAILAHAPESVELDGAGGAVVLLQGIAPRASLYGVKVFPYDGGGAPDARIAEAIDRLVTAKCDGSLDVDVINLSLSGPVLHDGRNPLDRMVDAATRSGITCVVAASNTGPAQTTVGSPGSAFTALTVGGAVDPVHARVDIEWRFGLPGEVLFPHADPQVVEFSARGLTADGRVKPDLIASAYQLFSSVLADFDGDHVNDTATYWFGSGTSFSTPIVSGAAALVTAYARRQCRPARAPHVADALLAGADPIADFDRVGRRKQGEGFVRLPEAFAAVRHGGHHGRGGGHDGDSDDDGSDDDCSDDGHGGGMQQTVSLGALHADGECPPLAPGESFDFLVRVPADLANLHVTFPTVTTGDVQNPLLGDGLQVTVHTAKRGGAGDYVFYEGAVQPGESFDFAVPEPGTVRITMAGVPINYGDVAGSFSIDAVRALIAPTHEIHGSIGHDGVAFHTVTIPDSLHALGVRLVWPHDWTEFPTYDLDLFLQAPDGLIAAASLDSPEAAWIPDPAGGEWTFAVMDFATVRRTEHYVLQIKEARNGATPIEVPDDRLPRLVGTRPNPAAPATTLRFELPLAGPARLDVYDVAGRLVRSILDGEMDPGAHEVAWDGRSSAGRVAADGVYFVRLRTHEGTATRKVLLKR